MPGPGSQPCPKPQRGQAMLDREQAKADALAVERREKTAARKRDGRCRWPEVHKCRGGLESAHLVDASLGGPMHRTNLVTLCAWIHRRGPESIHGKQLMMQRESRAGASGPLSFWRRSAEPGSDFFYLVARETQPFEIERD